MIDILVSGLSFLLLALLAGNNLSVSSGAIISGRIVGRTAGILITVIGYIAGLLAQGSLLGYGFSSIMPLDSATLVSIALTVSIAMFVIGYRLRAPLSFSIIFTTSLIGISLAVSHAISSGFVTYIIAFWVLAPFASVIIAMLLMAHLTRQVSKLPVWSTLRVMKLLLIAASFLAAFTLGANTMGILFVAVRQYTSIWILVAAIVIGGFMMSAGPLKRIGNEILPIRYMNAVVVQSVSVALVELATAFSIPFSNTQAFTAGLYGTGAAYGTKLLPAKPLIIILLTWIFTAIMGLTLGYLLAAIVV
ncbi:MAG: inorganic phosphate transporter [Candidatus Marsarchaeota archaeon]|nr:inorganic phosphate transporter [Candidatus Marsarchaeota archaeon]